MIRAVLFDRDGTLIVDSPREGRVAPMPHAAQAVALARRSGARIGVITNQPAIADSRMSVRRFNNVNAQVERMVGAIDAWFVCPHAQTSGCSCRKPMPGLIYSALRTFGVRAAECAVIGDIGSDVAAGHAAGALSVLVPTPVTRAAEIEEAPVVCSDLLRAVEYVFARMPEGAR